MGYFYAEMVKLKEWGEIIIGLKEMDLMTRKLCALRCLYGIEGRCRLEHIIGERGPNCPHYEEDFNLMSRGRI